MSRVPLGKVLLRNVIRHTDAHNKIQEESEMWKMRDWEKQMSHEKTLPDTAFFRGRMHCDRDSDSREPAGSMEQTSGRDDREARYWSRKLYEFEANDPDRWGHSGFKELYPEDFTSNREEDVKKNGRHKTRDAVASSERSKKLSQKKKKKKKKKKRRDEKDRHKRGPESSSNGSSGGSMDTRNKQRHKKSKRKTTKSCKHRVRRDESSAEETEEEEAAKRKGHSHRKRKRNKDSHSEIMEAQKKRRKNCKATNEENSDDSSGD